MKTIKILNTLLLLFFFYTPCFAQEGEGGDGNIQGSESTATSTDGTVAEEEDDLEFQTGVISSMGTIKKSGSVPTSALSGVPGEEQAAVSGSVSKVKRGRCAAKVTNNSEKSSYSVRYKVVGYNSNGSSVFNRNFSSRLSPGQSDSNEFACRDELNMQLVVTSGKKLD